MPRPGPVVVDTDVASALIRRSIEPAMARALSRGPLCITFVTVGELFLWTQLRGWGASSRERVRAWLHGVTVIDSDERVSQTWGEVAAFARRRGRPRPLNDSWVAACCLAHGLPLATSNVKDYLDYVEHEGLELVGVSS